MDAESYFEIWVPFFLPYEVLQGSSVTPMLLALLTPGAERECEWMWGVLSMPLSQDQVGLKNTLPPQDE